MLECDSPIDLHIASVLEGARFALLVLNTTGRKPSSGIFLMVEPLKIFLVGGQGFTCFELCCRIFNQVIFNALNLQASGIGLPSELLLEVFFPVCFQ